MAAALISPFKCYLAGLAAALGAALTACGGGVPEPQPTATAPFLPTPSLAPTSVPTPAPTPTPGYSPGTTILNQPVMLSADTGSMALGFEGYALQVIRLDAVALSGEPSYQLLLYDKFGNALATLDGTDPGDAISELRLPYRGPYQVVLTPSGSSGTVQVTVVALDAPSGGATLNGALLGEAGQSAEGLFSVRRAYHTYQVYLQRGQVISIGAVPLDGEPLRLELQVFGPDGRAVQPASPVDGGGASASGVVVTESGLFTMIVTNLAGSMGRYRLTVRNDAVPPPAEGSADMVAGYDYRAGFYEGSDFTASFDGSTGDVLRVEVFDLQAAVDVDMVVISPFGQVIAYAASAGPAQAERINELQLPYTGRYQLLFSATGGGQGVIRLTAASAADLTGGGSFGDSARTFGSGRFTAPQVYHAYQFRASAGNRVWLAVRPALQDTSLRVGLEVLGPDGRPVQFAAGGAGLSGPSMEGVDLALTGVYTVMVYNLDGTVGSYEIEFTREE